MHIDKQQISKALSKKKAMLIVLPLNEYLSLCEPIFRNDFFTLIYLNKADEDSISIDFNTYTILQNNLFFISKNQFVDLRGLSEVEGNVLLFNATYFESLPSNALTGWIHSMFNHHIYGNQLQIPVQDEVIFQTNMQALFTVNQKQNEEFADKLEINHFESLILYAYRAHSQKPTTFKSMHYQLFMDFQGQLNIYQKHIRNVQFYLDELDVSLKQLNLSCKKVVGMTSKEYINQQIILDVKKALLLSHRSIAELSSEFNFDEATNFVKYFKKYTTVTPNHFREQNS